MSEWLVQPEWDEGDDWEPAVGTGEVVTAETADEARAFYLEHGDGKTNGAHWISCRPVAEAPSYAVDAGRKKAAERQQLADNTPQGKGEAR